MASDPRQLVLDKARVRVPSTQEMVDGLFKVNGYDGMKANADWQEMAMNQKVSRQLANDKYVFLSTGLFSLYHCTRMGSLSKTGKVGAPFGLFLSVWGLLSSQSALAAMRTRVDGDKKPEEKKVEA